MPVRLPSDLLSRSAQESCRLVALSYLDQIDRARHRLSTSADPESLHDFRVGLRRLRSCVRAYRAHLKGSVTGRMRSELRELARATNAGRDTEVQLTWLRKHAERMQGDDIQGVFWFAGRLEGRKEESLDPATAKVSRRYSKRVGKLRRALGVLRIDIRDEAAPAPATFGQVTGRLIRQQVVRLREDLKELRDPTQVEEAHRARISVKRLRYLLEAVARRNRRIKTLIPRLKEAQDLLGEHHDMHVLACTIASTRAGRSRNGVENSAGFPGLEHGLASMERLANEQAAAAFERFMIRWGGELAGRVLARADEIGQLLEEPARHTGTLASSLPSSEPPRLPDNTVPVPALTQRLFPDRGNDPSTRAGVTSRG